MPQARSDFDNPWKEALELFLNPFLAFFFPHVHAAIDWSRGHESLDKELQQIVPDGKIGRRLADKLFKVWRLDGQETWLLIHVEIQGRKEAKFPERMFVYNYRIYDHHHVPVMSLAVLTDDDPNWRPETFEYGEWGCQMKFRFLTAKLLDYAGREEELAKSTNPFGAVVLAHLKTRATRQMPSERGRWKLRLVQGLYDVGLKADEVRQLFRLIDWMVQLPEELQRAFRDELHRFEEARRMPYVTSIERLARQEGLEEGLGKGLEEGREEGLERGRLQGIIEGIFETRFGASNKQVVARIRAINEVERLRKLAREMKSVPTLGDAKQLLR